jgi:DUF1009 family protein
MQAKNQPLGIIAGAGAMPLELVYALEQKNRPYCIVLLDKALDKDYQKYPHVVMPIGRVGKILEYLKSKGACELVFAGSVKKPNLLTLKVDLLGAKLIAKITKNKLFGDNAILSLVIEFLEEQNFIIKGIDQYLNNILTPLGNLSKVKASPMQLADIKLASMVAKTLGALDVGQGVIVENLVVLGVEAIEGTNALIERCAKLKLSAMPDGCLVKMKKPQQEGRIDLPTIGGDTVRAIHQAKFAGIALESNASIILDMQATLELADDLGIFIVGI